MKKTSRKTKSHADQIMKEAEVFARELCSKYNIDCGGFYFNLILKAYVSGMDSAIQKIVNIKEL